MMEWQPIETAPKDKKAVLVYVPINKCTFCVSWDEFENDWRIFGGLGGSIYTPSHWMPLPPPPKDAA